MIQAEPFSIRKWLKLSQQTSMSLWQSQDQFVSWEKKILEVTFLKAISLLV
jgi:hypothetical protein